MNKGIIIWDGGKRHIRYLKKRMHGGNVKKTFQKMKNEEDIEQGLKNPGIGSWNIWMKVFNIIKLWCMKFSVN